MKIIIAANQLMGHLNPILAIGRILVDEGHEVVGVCGSSMRRKFEDVGAKFCPFPEGADQDLSDLAALYPEFALMPAGFEKARYSVERLFVDPFLAQHQGLQEVLSWFPADVIIGENLLIGLLPMLLRERSKRPPIIMCGTTYLLWHRQDGAPVLGGFAPAGNGADRSGYRAVTAEYETAFLDPIRGAVDTRLKEAGIGPLRQNLFDSLTMLPEFHLQLTTPGFEFPREDLPRTVKFLGPLPIVPNQAPIPSWAHELDGSRKVVLVTQGSVANYDFSELVVPTLEALAAEDDVLVVVTCGGRPTSAVSGSVPHNARLADYLPFEWLLPKVDAFVTNGGYGSVNQALSHGIPLVTAGMTEDKADVNARVSWSGVGIDLQTPKPTPTALRAAVRTVLDTATYRSRAEEISREMAAIDTKAALLKIIADVTAPGLVANRQLAA